MTRTAKLIWLASAIVTAAILMSCVQPTGLGTPTPEARLASADAQTATAQVATVEAILTALAKETPPPLSPTSTATPTRIVTPTATRAPATATPTPIATGAVACPRSIGFGETVQCDISPIGDQDSFTFKGAKGDLVTVYLDNQASGSLSLVVAKPDGDFWYSGFSGSDVVIDHETLPAMGTYTITVDSEGVTTGPYALQLIRHEEETALIADDQSVEGEISLIGEEDRFTFEGTEGERVTVYLDDQTSSGDLLLRLVGPYEKSWSCYTSWTDPCLIEYLALPATGTYTITVDGAGVTTGPYALRLIRHKEEPPTPIVYGQPVEGGISQIGEVDNFTFEGTEGDWVTVYLKNQTSGSLSLGLTSPEEDGWSGSGYNEDRLIDHIALPVTGTYTIKVYGQGITTGSYALQLIQHKEEVPTSIAYGQSMEGEISLICDQDSFTFKGAKGDLVTVYLDNQASGSLSLVVAKPDGDFWYSGFSGSDVVIDHETLPAMGTYTITVDSEGVTTGPYALQLIRHEEETALIADDQSVEGEISLIGEEDRFTFEGTEGERVTVYLDDQTSSGDLLLRLVGPYEKSWSCYTSWTDPCLIEYLALPATGTYTITVDGAGVTTGPYALRLIRHKEEPPTPIVYGQPVEGGISQIGEVDNFTFEGTEGDWVTVYLKNQTSGSLSLGLTSPEEDGWSGSGYNEDRLIDHIALPVTGTYTIKVYGQGITTGPYSLELYRHED